MNTPTTYRLILRPLSTFLTELQSDTIIGHLAWMAAYRGEKNITALIDRFKKDPPFIVSSAFPHDMLPFPTVSPVTHEQKTELADKYFAELGKHGAYATLLAYLKKIKKLQFLPLASWQEIATELSSMKLVEHLLTKIDTQEGFVQRRGDIFLKEQNDIMSSHTVMRTAVDRMTGSAADGLLYDHHETGYDPDTTLDVWFKFFDPKHIEFVQKWLQDLEINGYGANATSGAGQFEIISFKQGNNLLPQVANPNSFMTLSHFTPAASDPVEGWYNHITKRGKLGGTFAAAGNDDNPNATVWKYPLIMLTPGSVFKENRSLNKYYGRLVEHIHPVDKSIVHFGYSFPLGIRLQSI